MPDKGAYRPLLQPTKSVKSVVKILSRDTERSLSAVAPVSLCALSVASVCLRSFLHRGCWVTGVLNVGCFCDNPPDSGLGCLPQASRYDLEGGSRERWRSLQERTEPIP